MKKTILAALLAPTLALSSALAAVYPDLPLACKNGGGALLGDTAYVGLGSAGEHIYSLDLAHPDGGWQTLPAFPGGARDQPVMAAVDGTLYVFGGLQKNAKGELQLVNDAYAYDPSTQQWHKLPTRSPLGLVGTTAAVHGDRVYMIGGSNLSIFNGYFQDYTAAGDDQAQKDAVMGAYFAQRPQDYFFNTTLFSYEPATNRWYNDGALPFAGRAGAAVAVHADSITVANGEIKPGLRTADVEVGTFSGDGVTWQAAPELISADGKTEQDGLAGAYSGYSHGHYLLAGGANFPGARKQFAAGQLYAHQGLKKVHHADIYTLNDDKWQVIGKLPQGAGYGVSISYDNKLLLIGGATNSDALSSITVLDYDGKKLTVE